MTRAPLISAVCVLIWAAMDYTIGPAFGLLHPRDYFSLWVFGWMSVIIYRATAKGE